MDITPLVKSGAQIIQSYAGGRFRVSGAVYEGPLIVDTLQTQYWHYVKLNEVGEVKNLTAEAFEVLIDQVDEIDVVLFGTGASMQIPPAALRAQLKEAGLHVEFMDTGAACRTYNVLMAEGRRVVAALLPAGVF